MKEIRTIAQLIDALSRGEKVTPGLCSRSKLPHKQAKEEHYFCISIAGHSIAVHSMYSDIVPLCESYLCGLAPEWEISITDEDIAVERREDQREYPSRRDGYLETIAVYRKICEEMLAYDTFLMHGAVVAANNSAFMFTAPSGTGKTTHIKKWVEQIDGAFVVNGDKPLLKISDAQVLACGTPWCGKESLGQNAIVPLKAIVMMERGENNVIEEIVYRQAYSFLLQQTYWPSEADKKKKTLELLSKLNGRVRFFRFVFNNMKENALSVSYNALMAE